MAGIICGGAFNGNGVCGPDGHCKKIGADAGHRDKLLKASIYFTKLGKTLAEIGGASPATIAGFGTANSALFSARAILGIMNPFNGVPLMIKTGAEGYARAQGHGRALRIQADGALLDGTGQPVAANTQRLSVQPIQNVPLKERIAGAMASAFKCLDWLFFNFIFAIVSPISFISNHFKINPTAHRIGQQFTLLMTFRDAFSTGAEGMSIIHRRLEFNRLFNAVNLGRTPIGLNNRIMFHTAQAQVRTEDIRSGVKIVKGVADVVNGSNTVGKYGLRRAGVLTCGGLSAVIGLAEIYWGTSNEPKLL